ncbi:CvpA family protein [Acetivibrio clariflavus]|uniref:Putative membrane protein, required for colicin V production n=1 Tax=Acetivibrio clariflavus (strain DSM 19732 / NBRC 101661 / EBR45) TaxID=720554 RepID=G8LUL2_ACECE|nr:CvpA family protein [Acetivibrio clariflavus]AEV67352.1 putative membrane protein, required for colicin V production [Acetivibrio clariflavus DSM 19732]
MNWSDLLVIAIIAFFGFVGIKNGFIYSIFKLVSFFVASIVSVKFYPFLSNIIDKTVVFTKIKSGILKNLLLQKDVQADIVNQGAQRAAGSVVDGLELPGFLKEAIKGQLAKENVANLLDLSAIMDKISDVLAHIVVDILSLLILYIVVRIALIFLRFVLQGIAKLPVFKQMDKLGGFAFGAVEGLLTVYIIFAFMMLFISSPAFKGFFDSVETSVIAKFFYQNNIIVDWMFPKGKII